MSVSRNQIYVGVAIAVVVTFFNQAVSLIADKWQSNAWDSELRGEIDALREETEQRLNPLDVSRLDFSIDRRQRTVKENTEAKKKLEIEQGSDREQWSEPVQQLWDVYDEEQQTAASELGKLKIEKEAVFKGN